MHNTQDTMYNKQVTRYNTHYTTVYISRKDSLQKIQYTRYTIQVTICNI